MSRTEVTRTEPKCQTVPNWRAFSGATCLQPEERSAAEGAELLLDTRARIAAEERAEAAREEVRPPSARLSGVDLRTFVSTCTLPY